MPNHSLNDTHIPSMGVFMQSSRATEQLGDLNSNCVFRYETQLVANPDTQFLLGLTAAEIPYSFYNISTTSNFMRYQIEGYSTSTLLVVPEGNYDVYSLVDTINSGLLEDNTSIEFNSLKNKFSLNSLT